MRSKIETGRYPTGPTYPTRPALRDPAAYPTRGLPQTTQPAQLPARPAPSPARALPYTWVQRIRRPTLHPAFDVEQRESPRPWGPGLLPCPALRRPPHPSSSRPAPRPARAARRHQRPNLPTYPTPAPRGPLGAAAGHSSVPAPRRPSIPLSSPDKNPRRGAP